jgi:hypothetical protein
MQKTKSTIKARTTNALVRPSGSSHEEITISAWAVVVAMKPPMIS